MSAHLGSAVGVQLFANPRHQQRRSSGVTQREQQWFNGTTNLVLVRLASKLLRNPILPEDQRQTSSVHQPVRSHDRDLQQEIHLINIQESNPDYSEKWT